MHDFSDFYNFELTTYDRVTDLERLGKVNQLMPDMRDVRFLGQPEDWPGVRRQLVDFLATNIGDARYVGLGRRYIAYEVAGVLMKFLYKKKESDLLIDGKRVHQTNSRDTIMTAHQQEHAMVRRYFLDSVPDTLFVAAPFPVGGLNGNEEVKNSKQSVHTL